MPRHNHYIKGDWKAICDSCGREYMASDLRMRWDGLMVCSDDFEVRQPQDFVRGVAEHIAVPWSRPQTQDIFIGVGTYTGAVAGYAIASQAISGFNFVILTVPPSTFTP